VFVPFLKMVLSEEGVPIFLSVGILENKFGMDVDDD
jgi:hypothetical protein